MPIMKDRTRKTFDVPERVRRALGIEAAKKGISVGELIEILAERNLQKALQDADEELAAGTPPPKTRRGRKPKSGS